MSYGLDKHFESDPMTPIQGRPFSIGTGFDALNFTHTMYAGTMDPFIMVDYFTMTEPTFGPHAHAGLSAVTILFEESEGAFNNRDSLGNNIDLMPGDLYWLKAGRGAVHDEKPSPGARTKALQVFVNLPARMKYDAPESLYVKSTDMPVYIGNGYRTRLMLGESDGLKGSSSPALHMTILDVYLEENASFSHEVPSGQTALLLAIKGWIGIQNGDRKLSLKSGTSVSIRARDNAQTLVFAGNSKTHFVILQAEPLDESFVQRGSFAMSTEKEIAAMFTAHAAGELGSLDDS